MMLPREIKEALSPIAARAVPNGLGLVDDSEVERDQESPLARSSSCTYCTCGGCDATWFLLGWRCPNVHGPNVDITSFKDLKDNDSSGPDDACEDHLETFTGIDVVKGRKRGRAKSRRASTDAPPILAAAAAPVITASSASSAVGAVAIMRTPRDLTDTPVEQVFDLFRDRS